MIKYLLPLALLATACGDDGGAVQPDAPGHQADGTPVTVPHAYIVAGDFHTGDPGVMAKIDPANTMVTKMVAPAGAVGSDPLLRHLGNKLVIVNRTDNNVTVLDDQTLALVGQFSTGDGSDPQDAAIVGNTIYAPVLIGKGVVAIDMTTEQATTIDLSADDADGSPDCASIYAVGTKLYVACGLLDATMQYAPRGPGKVYVIDSATNTKVAGATVTLTTKNPITLFERAPETSPLGGKLVIGTVDFTSGAGCTEVVPVDGTTTTATCLVDNTLLAGYFPSRYDFHGDDSAMVLWMATNAADFSGKGFLTGYDFATHALFPNPVTPAAQSVNDVVVCPGDHYVYADHAMDAAGVRVRGPNSEATTTPLDVGLAPKSSHGLVCF